MENLNTLFLETDNKLKNGDFGGVAACLRHLKSIGSSGADAQEAIFFYIERLFEHLCNAYSTIEYCMNNYLANLVDVCFSFWSENPYFQTRV